MSSETSAIEMVEPQPQAGEETKKTRLKMTSAPDPTKTQKSEYKNVIRFHKIFLRIFLKFLVSSKT